MWNYITFLRDYIKSNFFNKFIFSLVIYDWKKQYKGSLFGTLWTFIKPVFSVVLFLFGNIVISNSTLGTGTSSIFSLILGMLPWIFISESMVAPSYTFTSYGFLITKMKYSKFKILFFTNLSRFIQHFILMVLFFIGYFIVYFVEHYGGNWGPNPLQPNIYMLELPLIAVLMFVFFYSWSIFTSILSIISNDFRQIVTLLITGIFWISGTFYNPANINTEGTLGPLNSFIQQLTYMNPLATFLSMFRNAFCVNFENVAGVNAVANHFFYDGFSNWYPFLWVLIWTVIFFIGSLFVVKKTKEWFNDQL